MVTDVIVLAGQSNMAGGANMPSPAPTYANASRIYRKKQPWASFNQPVDVSNPGSGAFELAVDPIHSQPGAGVGLGMACADRYLTLKNDAALNVGLVPCGWSSSRINTEWARMLHYGSAFGMTIARSQAAQKECGPIRGLVWYQGEQEASTASDHLGHQFAFTPDIYPAWMVGLLDLICKFRQLVADVPVVVVQLGPNPNSASFPNWANMQSQQSTIVGVDSRTALVTASDLTTIADGVHLNAASQVALGHRVAEALFALQ